ncbi:MAG: hypothetical protein L3J76_00640 [Candidatus Hydrothermae bacterium]|nr:hypothetical protein [Candidatus Hydrothermae bacterium]
MKGIRHMLVLVLVLPLVMGVVSCNLVKEAVPTEITVYGVLGEMGPATGSFAQYVPGGLPASWDTVRVQSGAFYFLANTDVLDSALVIVDQDTLTYDDSLQLYYNPVSSGVPVPGPLHFILGQTAVRVIKGDIDLVFTLPTGASLDTLRVVPDTVRAGSTFTIQVRSTGTPDSIVIQLTSGAASWDTVVQASSVDLTPPDSFVASLQTGLLQVTATAIKTETGLENVTPVSALVISRARVAEVPILP